MSGEPADLRTFTVATFSPLIGGVFRLRHGDGDTMETRLIEATAHGPGPSREQFSLVFQGTAEVVLPQRTYTVDNDDLGTFDLFLVPIARDAEGTRYEAVFA
ncbi:MAG: DUF6916 family protein [Acidimicrobiales bacterium]